MKKKQILKLEVKNWNKTPRREQDKALLLLLRVMVDLSENYRKTGIADVFGAEYP